MGMTFSSSGKSIGRKEPIIHITLCSDKGTFNVTFISIPTFPFCNFQSAMLQYNNSSREVDMALNRNNGRNTDGKFARGNPGKPKGARHKATLAVQSLLDGSTEALTQKAVDMALEGDTTALRLCLERICPARKDMPVIFDLPEMNNSGDVLKAASAVLASVANAELTPIEGASVMALVESYRRTLEVTEFEKRIETLEAQN